MIKPWKKISSKTLANYRIFNVRSDIARSPETGVDHDFYVIEAVNWVNVIATTANGELVMINQFRHGSDTIELEVPGGMMDPEDESPVAAALRELREETGYEGTNARIIGQVYPNPAIMSNTCYTVLVENCRYVAPVEFDQTEELVTRLVPAAEIPTLVGASQIRHALVLCALFHYEVWRRKTT